MANLNHQQEIEIQGNVVEISINEEKQIIKLALKQCYLEVTIENLFDVHLGDNLCFNGNFQIKKIIQEINNGSIN